MSGRAAFRWRPQRVLPESAPSGTVLEFDGYDWWHFRRLEAHEPGLFQRIISGDLVAAAFDLYLLLYKPRWRIRPGAPKTLSAAVARVLERRGQLERVRRRTVLNEWATIAALPELLKPLIEAVKTVRGKKGEDTSTHEGAVGAVAARQGTRLEMRKTGAAHDQASAALARFDSTHGLDDLPPADKQPRGGPALRRRGLQSRLAATGRMNLLAERDRLVDQVIDMRKRLQLTRREGREDEDAALTAIANGEDPAVNASSDAAVSAVDHAMEVVEAVRQLFRENDTWGRDVGGLCELPLELLLDLGARLRKEPTIRTIVELAGRWTVTLKRRFPRGKCVHGRSEVVGVDVGGDLQRLIPSELVLLAHPAYRRALLARLIERRALVTQLRGPHLLGRGPIIALVDTSGSMDGPRAIVAKAICLALALRAWEKRRPMYVLTFGTAHERHEVSLAPTDDFMVRMKTSLKLSFGGGTDFDAPLQRVVELARAKPWSQADAVFISDGHCDTTTATRELLAQAKRQDGLEVIGVLLAQGEGLRPVADHLFSIDPNAAMTAEPDQLLRRIALRV